MSDSEKKLNSILSAHGKRADDKTRALEAAQKERQQRAIALGKYATTVLEPQLRKLAKIVEGHGHRVVVHVTGAIAADGTPSRATIRVIPAGFETKNADKHHPSLQFELSAHHAAINVHENAVYGGMGTSQSAGTFMPDELNAAKIESLFVDLMSRSFKT